MQVRRRKSIDDINAQTARISDAFRASGSTNYGRLGRAMGTAVRYTKNILSSNGYNDMYDSRITRRNPNGDLVLTPRARKFSATRSVYTRPLGGVAG